MKQIFTLLVMLLSAIASFALNNRLTISTSGDNNRIRVMVDGRNYQANNSQGDDIVIDDLRAGFHTIKVYKMTSRNRGWGNNNNNNNNMQLLYNGNVYVKNGFHTDITINRFGKALVDEKQIDRYYDNDDDDNNYNNGNGWNWNNQPMNERSFDQLKQSIKRESFEDGKLSILKSAVRDNRVSVSQATELVKLFSFENNKLEAAKYLYHYTTDYQDYYLVANAFSFGSNKQELLRYIEQNRRNN